MSEVDVRLADRLLRASSVIEVATVLTEEKGEYTHQSLTAELRERQGRLEREGLPAGARLVGSLITVVDSQRHVIERTAAMRVYAASDATFSDLYGPQDSDRIRLEGRIAELARKGCILEALELVREAARLPLAPADLADAAACRHFLADQLRGLGRSREALEILLFDGTVGWPPGPFRDSSRGLMAATRFAGLQGLLYEDVGEYERGRACFKAAARTAREAGMDEEEIRALTNLAASLVKAGRTSEAVRAFRQLVQRAETSGNEAHLASALNNLALVAPEPDTSRACYLRVLEIYERNNANGLSVSNAYFGLGDLAEDEDRSEEAASAYLTAYLVSERGDRQHRESAVQYLADRLERGTRATELLMSSPHTFSILTDTIESGDWNFASSFFLGKARVMRAQGDREGAVRQLREVLELPELRSRGQGRADELRVVLDLAELLAASPSPGEHQEAFDLLWQQRGLLLGSLSPADRVIAMRRFRRLYDLLALLLVAHGDGLRLPDSRPAIHLAFDLHEEAKSAVSPVGFERLRTLLEAEDLAYVSFFCTRESTVRFTYCPGMPLAAAVLPVGAVAVADAARRLRTAFNGDPDTFPPLAPLHPHRPGRRPLDFLDDLSPLLPEDDGLPELLLVSADGPLANLPLTMFRTRQGSPYVLDHAVVSVLSATVLANLLIAASPPSGDVLCVAVAAREDPNPELLENDAELFAGTGWNVRTITGPDATPETVSTALRGARIAHLTCHGYLDERQRLDSGLLLARDGLRPSRHPRDLAVTVRSAHLLTPVDLSSLSDGPSLVTLRACSAGVRDGHVDAGVADFVGTFLVSGVSTVIAPLWNVAQDSSRRILGDLYQALAAEPSRPLWQVLWEIQRRMVTDPARPWDSHPYHWAALTVFGLWRTP
jgi:tetratricopeptide (TPR) repeat protein